MSSSKKFVAGMRLYRKKNREIIPFRNFSLSGQKEMP